MKKFVRSVILIGMLVVGLAASAHTARAGIFDSSDYSGAGAYDYRMSSAMQHARHSQRTSRRGKSRRQRASHRRSHRRGR